MNENIKKYNLNLITFTCLISALAITLINLFNLGNYNKIIVVPLSILVINNIILIKKNNLEVNKKAYLFLIPITLILISNLIIKIDFSNTLLNLIILPIIITMFLFNLTNKNYYIGNNLIKNIFKLFPNNLFNNLNYIKFKEKDNKKLTSIITGCAIGFPIALILLLLLKDADKYFGKLIDNIFGLFFDKFDISLIFSNFIFPFTISFTILFAIFINILKNKDFKFNLPNKKEVNDIITKTILIIINSVFVLFLISEISKITTNFLKIPVSYTYAKYAREGFFQLLIVTSINFGIIIYYLYKTDIIKTNKGIKNLLILLILFSIFLIFNSYYRMFLYINEYGFTILRLQVIFFITMELILFGLLIKKIVYKLKYYEGITFTTIFIITYILNLYLCNESFINLIN